MGAVWTVEQALPTAPEAAAVLRLYLAELISRVQGRETDDAEVDRHLREGHGSEDLIPPAGLLLIARRQGEVVGCVGLRHLDPQTQELTRMFVRPEARGEGCAARLLAAAEDAAREMGAGAIRLSTRSDLVEARAMYAKHGYVEIARYGDDEFAGRWFEKVLADGRDEALISR